MCVKVQWFLFPAPTSLGAGNDPSLVDSTARRPSLDEVCCALPYILVVSGAADRSVFEAGRTVASGSDDGPVTVSNSWMPADVQLHDTIDRWPLSASHIRPPMPR